MNVIFDMDGLMFDTESVFVKVLQIIIGKVDDLEQVKIAFENGRI